MIILNKFCLIAQEIFSASKPVSSSPANEHAAVPLQEAAPSSVLTLLELPQSRHRTNGETQRRRETHTGARGPKLGRLKSTPLLVLFQNLTVSLSGAQFLLFGRPSVTRKLGSSLAIVPRTSSHGSKARLHLLKL